MPPPPPAVDSPEVNQTNSDILDDNPNDTNHNNDAHRNESEIDSDDEHSDDDYAKKGSATFAYSSTGTASINTGPLQSPFIQSRNSEDDDYDDDNEDHDATYNHYRQQRRRYSITQQLDRRRALQPTEGDPPPPPPPPPQTPSSGWAHARSICCTVLAVMVMATAWEIVSQDTDADTPFAHDSSIRHILDRTVVSTTLGDTQASKSPTPHDKLEVLLEQTWFSNVYPNVRDMQDHVLHHMQSVQANTINATRLDLYVARREYECHLWKSDARAVQYAYALLEEYCTQHFPEQKEHCPIEWEIAFPSYGAAQ
jgi:hypothetical protein